MYEKFSDCARALGGAGKKCIGCTLKNSAWRNYVCSPAAILGFFEWAYLDFFQIIGAVSYVIWAHESRPVARLQRRTHSYPTMRTRATMYHLNSDDGRRQLDLPCLHRDVKAGILPISLAFTLTGAGRRTSRRTQCGRHQHLPPKSAKNWMCYARTAVYISVPRQSSKLK